MENQKIETYLPLFSGFYNSIWEIDYESINGYILEERKALGLYSKINDIDVDIDYKQYENDIAISLCDSIKNELEDYIIDIDFQSVYNPKTYNFYNDSINCIITPNAKNIKDFIYKNKENFILYLKNKYTSCDGFISHYSNNFQDWESETKNFTNFNIDGHRLGSIIDFIIYKLSISEYDLYYDVIEDINIFKYVENLNELINYTDNSLYELFTSNGYSKDIANYYESCFKNNSLRYNLLNEKTISIINQYKENLNAV